MRRREGRSVVVCLGEINAMRLLHLCLFHLSLSGLGRARSSDARGRASGRSGSSGGSGGSGGSGSLGGILLADGLGVDADVEGNEQEEVRGEDGAAREGSVLLAGTAAVVGHVGEVGGGEVGVGGKVDKEEINDELNDLDSSDPLLPPHTDTSSREEVVKVHDKVDKQVEHNGDPRDGGVANELGVAEESGSTVVVGVQEGEGLFLENKEQGVKELEVLGQVVEPVGSDNGLGPGSSVANGVKDALTVNDGDELLQKQDQQEARPQSQKEVVDLEQKVELVRGTVPHDLSAAKDDDVVKGDGSQDGVEGGEGQVLGELKALGVPANGLGDMVKNVPQVEAKGAIDRGDGKGKRRRHGEICGRSDARWIYGWID